LISEEFKWEKEFSKIMKNGGFDVIIGNPQISNSKILRNKLSKKFRKSKI